MAIQVSQVLAVTLEFQVFLVILGIQEYLAIRDQVLVDTLDLAVLAAIQE